MENILIAKCTKWKNISIFNARNGNLSSGVLIAAFLNLTPGLYQAILRDPSRSFRMTLHFNYFSLRFAEVLRLREAKAMFTIKNRINNQISKSSDTRHKVASLFCDGANSEAEAAVVAAPITEAAVEVEAVRVVATVLAQRARPVVAVRATAVDLCAGAVTRSGEKD